MQGMFRKAALDKVSSPEQLDLMMQVTSPLGWLALATIGGILSIVLAWSVVGSIPDLVDGQGVLLRGERLFEIKAGAGGTIVRLDVTPGTNVTAGQVIAVISRDKSEIQDRITAKREQLARAQAQVSQDASADEIQIARNQSMLGAKRQEIESLRQQRKTQEELVAKGLKPANVLFDFDRRITGVQGEMNGLDKENALIRQRLGPRHNEIANIRSELQQLENALQRTDADLVAPQAGRVVEVIKATSDKVRDGETLVRLEVGQQPGEQKGHCGGNIHAVIYLPGSQAGKVRPKQPARISPSDVKKEEYGYIVGEVAWVANFSASPDDMREKLKNDKLVQSYQAEGPVYEARVCLMLDEKNTNNGFKWSSSFGPPRKIDTGALATASLVVDERAPYTYVVPAVKKAVGL